MCSLTLTLAHHLFALLQVYLATAALLANGGQLKSGAAVAEAAVDSISSEATKAMKQIRKSVTNPLAMLRGGEKKPAAEAAPLYVGPRCALGLALCSSGNGRVSSVSAALRECAALPAVLPEVVQCSRIHVVVNIRNKGCRPICLAPEAHRCCRHASRHDHLSE